MTSATRPRAVAETDALPSISLLAACAFAVCLGLVLAVVLPGAAAVSAPWGERWRALVQVHGQAMVLGFAGLFILGMGARLLPRFSGAPLYRPTLLKAAFVLITAAVVGRSIAQPLADQGWARWLLLASGIIECAGAAAFATSAIGTLRKPLRARKPFAAFLAAGSLWLLVAALLTARALARVFGAHGMVVAFADDAPVLHAEFFGFLLCFIFGVSLRPIPVLYAWNAGEKLAWAAFALLQAGAVVLVVAAVAGDGPSGWWQASAIARIVLALALVSAAACMGVWRPASRLRDNSRAIGLLLRTAYGWAAAAALLLLYGAWEGLRAAGPAPDYVDDATRHVLAIGVVATMIVGMAYLAGHMFAAERASGTMALRLRVYDVLLGSAAFLRALAALLEGHGAPLWRFWLMSGAGVLVIVAIAWFASRVVWGLRHPYTPPILIAVH